ncbi:hypothetical protein [Burkholderia anthina]|uniref:hypothetical protein n=1 Tax=Burkholderia anthina TaxID=179879 RepID=UPI003341427C
MATGALAPVGADDATGSAAAGVVFEDAGADVVDAGTGADAADAGVAAAGVDTGLEAGAEAEAGVGAEA